MRTTTENLAIELYASAQSQKRKQAKEIWADRSYTWHDMPSESVEVWCAVASRVQAREQALREALENCHMMARRQKRKLMKANATNDAIEAWEHVVRFCESAGAKASVLRDATAKELLK